MKYTEKLLWILDKDGQIHWSEEKTKQNIDFVHSLGLKCDCVGWCKLDLSTPRAPEILDAIEKFCKENGWGARGYYTREFAETQSAWYAIRFTDAKNDRNSHEVPAESGGTTEVYTLKAYLEQPISPKEMYEIKFVPERFRNTCLKLGLDDVDFCWAVDKGKYRSEQYFHIYPKHAVSHIAKNYRFYYSTKGIHRFDPQQAKRIKDLGGFLPRLSEIFYELRITLPHCYLNAELPESGFSSAYIPRTRFEGGNQDILVHTDTAALLLKEKAFMPAMLMPVPVMDAFPAGYEILDTCRQIPPTSQYREAMHREYEKLKANPRPIRMVTEKEALKALRRAKKERKEDFQKALSKTKAPEVESTRYAPLLPYYSVTAGGFLSDEYELLSYARAVTETDELQKALQSEELLEEKPEGIVIAKCPDGDTVLLCQNNTVVRCSHEAPEVVEQWPSLAQFFVDAINDSD